MGRGTKQSRQARKLGKKWINIPKGFSMFKEESDKTYGIDVLGYVVKEVKKHPEKESIQDDVWYRYPYKLHRYVGPNKEDVICPGTIGKPCPRCEKMQEIYDDPDLDNKLASKYRPSNRSIFAIKLKSGVPKKERKQIMLWDISDGNFFNVVDKELEMGEEDWNGFASLEGGYTLKTRFIEDQFDKTKYPKADRVDFIPRKDYPDDILDKTPCLDDMIVPNIKTYKEIEEIQKGEKMAAKKSSKKGKGKGKKVDQKLIKKLKKKMDWEAIQELDDDECLELLEQLNIEPEDDEDTDAMQEQIAEILGIEPEEDEDDADDDDEESEDDEDDEDDDAEDEEDEEDEDDEDDNDDDDDDEDDEESDTDDEDDEDEKPPVKGNKKGKKPAKKEKKSAKSKKAGKKEKEKKPAKGKKGKKKCPFNYSFGVDFGDYDECNEDDCKSHDACFEEYDANQDEE